MSKYRSIVLASIIGVMFGVACCPDVWADDADALALADSTQPVIATPSPWSITTEAAWYNTYGNLPQNGERVSLDVAYRKMLSQDWEVVFSDRLDMLWSPQREEVNTLKEAYVDWRKDDAFIVDAGRINQRLGVAFGYNPTDVFKSDAIRDVISESPDSLRSDRLGVAMLRGQYLWSDGSLTGIVAPKIASQPSDAPLSPDFGATNNDSRWLLMGNQRLIGSFSPQWLIFGTGNGSPHVGLNLTAGIGDSTILYLEWSAGNERSQFDAANGTNGGSTFKNKASIGMTYTTSFNISVTLEYEFDQAALSAEEERHEIATDPLGYAQYLSYSSLMQENAARQAYFVYVSWNKFLSANSDLRFFARRAPADQSTMLWMQFVYKFKNVDISIERDLYHGSAFSAYGASPGLPRWQATFAYYF
jgi:hypothetical protein